MWEWFFSMPVDEMALKFKLAMSFNINFIPVAEEHLFENVIPGYTNLTEEEKQGVQKRWFIENKNKGKPPKPAPERKEAKS